VEPPVHHLLLAGRAPGRQPVDAALAGQVGGDDPFGEAEFDVDAIAAFDEFGEPLPGDRGVLGEAADCFRRSAGPDEFGGVQREESLSVAAPVRLPVGAPDVGIEFLPQVRIRRLTTQNGPR
jgi:hypothetical protein